MKTDMTLFESYKIRRVYDEDAEIWWFSVIDIIQVLTQQADYRAARNYWKVLKNRLKKEGSQLVTDCNQLKLQAADAKNAREELEAKTGKKVVTKANYLPKTKQLIKDEGH